MKPGARPHGGANRVLLPPAGFFPFYCQFHGDDGGSGMAGVVYVMP